VVLGIVLGLGLSMGPMGATGAAQTATISGSVAENEHIAGMGMPAMQRMMPHPGEVVVSFEGKEASWSAETLKTLPQVTVTVWNEHAKAKQTYTGVAVIELLGRLGFPVKPHGKDFRLYMVATGTDGYEVVFSGAELTPDVHEGTVLVAYAMDGKPIPAAGPLQLVATGEKRPARWVRNLASLRIGAAP
jgi:hypothetical protein